VLTRPAITNRQAPKTCERALTANGVPVLVDCVIKGDVMKLRPLHDRVIVKRLEQETKTASGIVIPDNAAEKPDQGEVLAVGPGKRNDKGDFVVLNIKVGDRVLFGKYSGQTVKVDGDELLVMREEDLFAVVEK
jgi:chaperonin GroES